MGAAKALVTVAVPSFNQGRFLDAALRSIFEQEVAVEVFVADGGSTDHSVDIIKTWAPRLSGWRSRKDEGQAHAINEAIAMGTAPYVLWLNSDDMFLPGGLSALLRAFENRPPTVGVEYGRTLNLHDPSGLGSPVWVEPFDSRRLALRCIIAQPATLIRRDAWEAVGGLNGELRMAMDYDLWWRLHRAGYELEMIEDVVAVNRMHNETKTRRNRRLHYAEARAVVLQHTGKIPLKWWLAHPYAVTAKTYFPFLP